MEDRTAHDLLRNDVPKGVGTQSNLYTAYTYAVKDGDKLIPFTRVYSGLTEKEFNEVA